MKVISLLFLLASCSTPGAKAKLNRQIQQCYEESDSVFAIPPVEGKMEFDLEISENAKVQSVKMTSSDFNKDRNLEACVYGILKQTTIEGFVKNEKYTLHEVIKFEAKKK